MSDTGWLIVAIFAAIVLGVAWIKRELWLQRKRGRWRKGPP